MAATGRVVRELGIYEMYLSTLNINIYLELVGPVTADAVKSAFNYARLEHPVLRMRIVPNAAGKLEFIDDPEQPIQLETFEGEVAWKDQLVTIGNTNRDKAESPCYMRLWSKPDGQHHQLFAEFNHAHSDAPGLFQLFHSFCRYLGMVLDGAKIELPASREFINVHARKPAEMPPPPEIFPAEIPRGLKPVPKGPNYDATPKVGGQFRELTKAETDALVEQLHKRKKRSTVQGAVSIASAVAYCQARTDVSLPVTLALACPCNMRRYAEPVVPEEDCVCAAAGLVWPQEMAPDLDVWDAVEQTTAKMTETAQSRVAFHMFDTINAGRAPEGGSFMSSSVGVNPIQTAYGSKLKVARVEMLGAGYVSYEIACQVMSHIHTFDGALQITTSYTMPSLDDAFAIRYIETQARVLRLLGRGEHAKLGDLIAAP